jgi:4-amino-4-deoxy-L-arabinose transferase-like glycosyltransferase
MTSRVKEFLRTKDETIGKDLAFLFITFGFAFFQFLGHAPLLSPDECRYAEIPREMMKLGDFVTPHLNYVKYFEKPPLHYWLISLSFSLFGQNEFAARFPSALMGLGGVILVYCLGRRLFDRRTALFAALALGTSIGYLFMSRMNIPDVTLSFCMTATMGLFLIAAQDGEQRKGLYYHLFYLFTAFAVLAKGLIGIVFPGAIIFLYLLATRRWKLIREMRLSTGLPLFLLVAAPWYVLISFKNPEFFHFFFIREHFQRFLSEAHGRNQPVWFFLPVLAGSMLPWVFFLPASFQDIWRSRDERTLFLGIWIGFVILFFSLSCSKLATYILPVFPAVALLVGNVLSESIERNERHFPVATTLAAMTLGMIGLATFTHVWLSPKPLVSPLIGTLLYGQFLGAGWALFAVRKKDIVTLVAVASICTVLIGIIGSHCVLGTLAARESAKGLARIIAISGSSAIVASLGYYEQGLPFYLKRRVVLVGGKGELEFGSGFDNASNWFFDYKQFRTLWDSGTPMQVLIRNQDLPVVRMILKKTIIILGREGNISLITNRVLRDGRDADCLGLTGPNLQQNVAMPGITPAGK